MRNISGKTVLVTGGAKRLGKACALALAEQGARIILHYNQSRKEADETAKLIEKSGSTCRIVQFDLAQSENVNEFAKEIYGTHGNIDIIINSASIFPSDTIHDVTLDNLHQNLAVNALSPFLLAKTLAELGTVSDIINFLDTKITGPDSTHISYHTSKLMLASMTKQLANELAPETCVNAIAPGPVLAPVNKDTTYLNGLKKSVPLQKTGSPEDITHALLFLLTNSFITGQILFIDGGMHLQGGGYGF